MPDCCEECYHTVTFKNRSLSEFSIEHILEIKNSLENDTVNIYISGCPALLLFELTVLKNNDKDLFVKLFKKALYYEEWKTNTHTVLTNDVCFVLNKLHTCSGFDSLYIVRHGKNV